MVVTTRAQQRKGGLFSEGGPSLRDDRKSSSGGAAVARGHVRAAVKSGSAAVQSAKSNGRKKERKAGPLSDVRFGLVQEVYQHNLYHLVVQAILWNQTRGKQAVVVLRELLIRYPTPTNLADAKEEDLATLLQPIGLFRIRAKRLLALGKTWIDTPPKAGHVYKVRYRCTSEEEAYWEIAHLPGVGKYAIDSYRIFHRDQLLGLSNSWDDSYNKKDNDSSSNSINHSSHQSDNKKQQNPPLEPEWKRVSPEDKDLRAFLQWAWKKQGQARFSPLTSM